MMMTMAYDNKPYATSVYARSWCNYAELIAMITFVISCLLLKFNGLTLYGYVYVVHALPVAINAIIEIRSISPIKFAGSTHRPCWLIA